MTCDTALELLLDAEPAELDGRAATPLGNHVRRCARCGRVAAQLMRDTRLLSQAMPARAVARVRRRAMPVLVPAFALGALVMAVALRSRPDQVPPVRMPAVELALPIATAPVQLSKPSVAGAATQTTGRIRRALPARAYGPAVAVAPVRFAGVTVESSSSPPASNSVSVTPPEGTRATVMHTSNPKLVVVWLH